MRSLQRLDKKWLLAIALLIILAVGVLLAGSSSDSQSSDSSTNANSAVSAGDVFNYSSTDGNITGAIKIADTFDDGLTSFDFAFIINHDVPNNGFCQSNDADYCKKETSQNIEEIKYRYGLTFASTEDAESLVATVYEPIYCNLDQAKADPFNIGYNKTDIACDIWMVPNWEPTNWFVAKSRSSTRNFSELLSGLTLNVYDIADEFVVEVEDGGAKITTNRLEYSQIPSNEKVTSFSLNILEN